MCAPCSNWTEWLSLCPTLTGLFEKIESSVFVGLRGICGLLPPNTIPMAAYRQDFQAHRQENRAACAKKTKGRTMEKEKKDSRAHHQIIMN